MWITPRYPLAPLAIFEDDLNSSMPFWESPFRVREYEAILNAFPGAAIYSTRLGSSGRAKQQVRKGAEEFQRHRPAFRGRIFPFDRSAVRAMPPAQLAYVVFLHNAFQFIDLLEQHRVPFCVELYPGGGFQLEQRQSDGALRRVTESPWFRGIIATQPITREYLLTKGFVSAEQMTYIYGGPFLDEGLSEAPGTEKRRAKHTLDLCFVAHRYSARGEDKGYDVFLELAERLTTAFPELRFHVVGGFDETIIPLSENLAPRIYFYGTQPTEFFAGFYGQMDAIISPNRANVLRPGGFDGFPTGCSLEAALQGTTVVCSDPLQLNRHFQDGKDIVIVEPDADRLAERLVPLLHDRETLLHIGEAGQALIRQLLSPAEQTAPRIELLEREIYRKPCFPVRRQPRRWLAYTLPEIDKRLHCLIPDQATMNAHGIGYRYVEAMIGGGIAMMTPPATIGRNLRAEMDLAWEGQEFVELLEWQLAPSAVFVPEPDVEFAFEIVARQHKTGPVVQRIRIELPARFTPQVVRLGEPNGVPFRYVEFSLEVSVSPHENKAVGVYLTSLQALFLPGTTGKRQGLQGRASGGPIVSGRDATCKAS